MPNQIEYGLKFNTQDMERLIKLAEKLDKQTKAIVKDYESGEKRNTEVYSSELKKRERQLKQNVAWQKQLRSIELANEKKMQAEITRNQKEEQRKRDQIAKQAQDGKFNMFAPLNTIKRVGGYIGTATVVYGSIKAMRDARTAIIEFEKQMSNVYAAIGNVNKADKLLLTSMAKSQHLISLYGVSAQEAAEGMNVLAKAGLNTSQILTTLEPALALTVAGDMKLESATENLIKVLNGFGLAMNNAGQIADYFAYSAAKSPTSVQAISDAMAIAAPSAKIFGQSVESAFAVVSAMSFAQLQGAQAGNAYSRIMLRLTKDQKEVANGLKTYGIDIYDKTTGKLRYLADIFIDIRKSRLMENFADAQKILGIYAFKSASQFTAVIDKVADFKKNLTDASGYVKKMAEIKLDNAAGEWKKLVAQFESLWTSNEGIAAALKNVLSLMNEMLIIGNTIAKSDFWKLFNYVPSIAIYKKATEELRNYRKEQEKQNTSLGLLSDNPLIGGGVNLNAPANSDQAEFAKDRLRVQQMMLGMSDKALSDQIISYKNSVDNLSKSIFEAWKIKDKFDRGESISKSEKDILLKQKDNKELKQKILYYSSIAEAVKKTRDAEKGVIATPTNQTPRVGGGGGGKGKQRIDDFKDFIDRMKNLQRQANEIELSGWDNKNIDIKNKFQDLIDDLNRKILDNRKNGIINVHHDIALQELKIARFKEIELEYNKWVNSEVAKAQEERYKTLEDYNKKSMELIDRHYEEISDIYDNSIEKYGSLEQRQKLLDEQYLQQFKAIKEEAAIRSLSAQETEEMLTNLKKDYTEKRIAIAYEAWQRENQIANVAIGAIGAGYDTLSQSMTDMDMSGQKRREMIWESFRSTAITAIMEVVKQKIIAMAMELAFDKGKKAAETAATVASLTATSTAAAAATPGMAAYATATQAAAVATGVLTGGTTFATAALALAGLTTSMAAYFSVLGTGSSLTSGSPLADAVVANGKVHPYRKDDLVMIGTGLGSKSGANLPDRALPQGLGQSNNTAFISELKNLRLAVVRSDANNVKAINNNTPIVQGTMMDNVMVYKASKLGEKQSSFIVKPS